MATLEAKRLAARSLLIHEDPVKHAEETVAELTPHGVETSLNPEDFQPGDSFAAYYGRKADKAIKERDTAKAIAKTKTLKLADAGYEEEQREALMLGYVTSVEAQQRGWTLTTLS